MAAFLAGVTQAPLTAAVISLELTANQNVVIPLMAVCLLSRGVSSLACQKPVYRAFADRLIEEFEQSRTPETADASVAHSIEKENDPR
jgi:H+/Cl- antiporter ClcA